MENWPIYFNDLLVAGNKESEVGIISLWTKASKIARVVDKEKYAIIGQLYSKDEGLSALIRNCLYNKKIRHLIICGNDLNKSGDALLNLMKHGVDKNYKVVGRENAYLHKEIPLEDINKFRFNVKVHDLRSENSFSKLNSYIDHLVIMGSYGDKKNRYPESKIVLPDTFPSENTGFTVREKYVGDAWLKILFNIMRFGALKESQQSDKQKEIIDIISIITYEDPDKPEWRSFYPFTKKDLKTYYPQILTTNNVEGVEYTYGQRLRNNNGIDQVKSIIKELKNTNYSRRAIAVTWDVELDNENQKSPCLNLVQALVQDNKLCFTAYIRSNDMFDAWPMNAYALRKLQKLIASKLDIDMGDLVVVSCSAHIYESKWKNALDVLKYNKPKLSKIGDPRGNIAVSINKGLIHAKHLSPAGKGINCYSGKNAEEVYEKLALDNCLSEIYHALNIGSELQKAELALKLGIKYEQEEKLKLK